MARRITLCIVIFASLLAYSQSASSLSSSSAEKKDAAAQDSAETKLILESLSKRYEAIGSWEASFMQTEKSPGLSGEVASEGYFKFVLNNKFLLHTDGEIKKTFVSDGHQAWFIEDNPQAKERYYVRKFNNSKGLELERFLIFFQGLKSHNKGDFEVSGKFNKPGQEKSKLEKSGPEKPELEVTLVPKNPSDFVEIKIYFPNVENYPNRLVFTDAVGGVTNMKILEARPIKKIDPDWFVPRIPKGIVVHDK